MDFNELKKIIKLTGGKYIFIENDEPNFVLMSFDEYKKMAESSASSHLFKNIPESEFKNKTEDGNPSSVNFDDLNKKNIDDLPIM